AFVQGILCGNRIATVEGDKIKPLGEDEDVAHNVTASADIGSIMAAGASVRVRARDAIEIAREHKRILLVGKRRASAFVFGTTSSLLSGPASEEQASPEIHQARDRELILLPIL